MQKIQPYRMLAILTLINLFNYLDRFVVSALVETLKKSELHLLDAQAGLLMTGFIVVYMFACPVFGALGDRYSRTRLVASGVAIWSISTALGGLAGGFISLFIARAMVGIGEAAYGTIAPTLIADLFPVTRRGRMFAIFFSAIPIGSALGYVVGGLVDQHYGWRAAFYVAGLPGIFLALLAATLPDPPRGAQDDSDGGPDRKVSPETQQSAWKTYLDLRKNRPYMWAVLGYAASTFALGGLAFWMPAYLERVRGLPKAQATVQFGAVIVITGFLGTFSGGWLGDYFLKRSKEAYLWVCGITSLLAVPFTFMALLASDKVMFWGGMFMAELLLFASMGPVNSAMLNRLGAGQRAMGVAACNFTIHILGDVPSPSLIGFVSDRSSLLNGLLLVPFAVLVSAILWCYGAWQGEKS